MISELILNFEKTRQPTSLHTVPKVDQQIFFRCCDGFAKGD